MRLALDKGTPAFARQIIAQLPPAKAGPYMQWAAILDNPQRGIDAAIGTPSTPVDPDALFAGWKLLVRRDRSGAVARYDSLVRARQLVYFHYGSRAGLLLGISGSHSLRPYTVSTYPCARAISRVRCM